MVTRKYQVRFESKTGNEPTKLVGNGPEALRKATDIQSIMVDLTTEDNVKILWQGVIATMKPWYLNTGCTFVLIEWADGSKLIMEPVTNA